MKPTLPSLRLVILAAALLAAPTVPSQPVAQSESSGATHSSKAGLSGGPDCSGGWPTIMTFVELKNAGITNNENVDFSKTKTVRIASEKTGKDLYHQVYEVTYTERSGRTIDAIVVADASYTECSMNQPEIFVVSQHL